MRTSEEIRNEIAAIKALKPTGKFKEKTARSLELAIEELELGVDETSDEWYELTYDQQDLITKARRWKTGELDGKPSEGWGELVE